MRGSPSSCQSHYSATSQTHRIDQNGHEGALEATLDFLSLQLNQCCQETLTRRFCPIAGQARNEVKEKSTNSNVAICKTKYGEMECLIMYPELIARVVLVQKSTKRFSTLVTSLSILGMTWTIRMGNVKQFTFMPASLYPPGMWTKMNSRIAITYQVFK